MKKMRLFALMLALVTFVFAGCSMNQKLKLEKSNFSASEFYANSFYNQMAEGVDVKNISVAESEKTAFLSVVNATMSNEFDMLLIVCAMDFHLELSTGSNNTEKSKFYEFKGDESNIVVSVVKKASSTFSVSLYFTNYPVTEIEYQEAYIDAEIKLTDVSKNINYTLTYERDDVDNLAEFTYDQSKGYMLIKLKAVNENVTNSLTREIYDYVGDVCSVRTTSKIVVGGVNITNAVYEIMKSPFLIRQKIGELSDSAMKQLNKVTQDEIANKAISDEWCYILTAKASEEGAQLKWRTSFNKYGSIKK